jgi:hypothetical protein
MSRPSAELTATFTSPELTIKTSWASSLEEQHRARAISASKLSPLAPGTCREQFAFSTPRVPGLQTFVPSETYRRARADRRTCGRYRHTGRRRRRPQVPAVCPRRLPGRHRRRGQP